jgi:hypothetical protein
VEWTDLIVRLGIFLEIAPEEPLRRALVRDPLRQHREHPAPVHRAVPARPAALPRTPRPTEAADIVIDHNDPANPEVLERRIGPAAE